MFLLILKNVCDKLLFGEFVDNFMKNYLEKALA